MKSTSASGRLHASLHRHETKLAILLLALGIPLAVAAPRFFSSVNLALLARNMGVLLIVSVGMRNVILAGGIDVSAGAILAVVSVVLVRLGNHGLAASAVLPLGLLTGAALGAVNAALIAELRIPPIVATLGRKHVRTPSAPNCRPHPTRATTRTPPYAPLARVRCKCYNLHVPNVVRAKTTP